MSGEIVPLPTKLSTKPSSEPPYYAAGFVNVGYLRALLSGLLSEALLAGRDLNKTEEDAVSSILLARIDGADKVKVEKQGSKIIVSFRAKDVYGVYYYSIELKSFKIL